MLKSPASVTLDDQSVNLLVSKPLLKMKSDNEVGVKVGVRVAEAVGDEVSVAVDVGVRVSVGEGV